MALTNYTELQTALANWLHRADLTSRIPEFIALAEAGLNRQLRLTQMVTQANIAVTAGSATAALPTGFLAPIEFVDDNYEPLKPVTGAEILQLKSDIQSKPKYYAIDTAITFECTSDANYTYIMRYYQKLDLAADGTNWLMTNAPNVYLYASLAEAAQYLKDMRSAQAWIAMADNAIAAVKSQDRRLAEAPLRTEITGIIRSSYNINTDS